MILSASHSQIFSSLFSDPEIAALFSDEQFIRYLLQVEAALAIVQGRLGIIPTEAAKKIALGAAGFEVEVDIDMEALQGSTEKAGVPVMGLVKQLRERVGGEAGSYVHWGATTQDIMDTALVLQIRAALEKIEQTMQQVIENLAQLADQHRHTLMAGRTHSQQALPITFGLKVAGWIAPLLRHRQRLRETKARILTVQFGGAAGTLAPFGQLGIQVQEELAKELNFAVPLMPWHTQRDNLAELAGWLSLVSGTLAKMAQDIILMAQTEVGEVRESSDRSRGGSSTMPQKSNPIVSELIIAAARTNATLLASMHHALIHEQERATHSWQVEWLNFPQMFVLTAVALNKALFLSHNLVVNDTRMRQNVAASNGLMLGEAISFALASHMSRAEAKTLIRESCWIAIEQNRHLVDVVRQKIEATLPSEAPIDWHALKDESAYLGSTDAFIERVLREAAA
ncbi:MAG: 3-carboxy-cis,cis-muconate cycloisomerase [Ardenticatenaceae bacterium]